MNVTLTKMKAKKDIKIESGGSHVKGIYTTGRHEINGGTETYQPYKIT